MSDLADEITFDLENLPGWAIAYLDNVGLPLKLYPEIMSEYQKKAFVVFSSLIQGVEDGFIEVTVEDGRATFQVTEKGIKHVESIPSASEAVQGVDLEEEK